MSGGHGHLEGSNKNIAILIAVLAALLAIAEMGAKSSQTSVLTEHVEATNQWAFFQAKTVRQTVIVRQGVAADLAKRIVREIKDGKLKVQVAIQGDELRVTGKKRDDLQAAIQLVRGLKNGPKLLVGGVGDSAPRRDARLPERFCLPDVADPGHEPLVEQRVANGPAGVAA